MKQKRVPLIRQVGITDCGFACLTMLFNYYGYNIDISELKAKNSVGRNGLSLAKLKEICQENYFQFKAYKNFSSENDLLMNLPAILFSKTNHYVVVSRKRNNTFELLDPVKGKIQVSFDDIQREYMDILVVIRPRDKFIYSKEKSKFKIPVNRFKLAIVILTTLIAQSIIIIPAIFVQKIVNNLTYAPESFEFRKMILFILGITIALFLSNFIKKRCILILQSDIYKETIQQMIDKIFKIDISFFEGHASGDIQNRFNSVSEIYQFISITLISAIINAVTAIMCALVMMLQSFYLFQILFIIAAAQILIVYFLNKRARIKIKNYIADQSELQGKMVEILTNIQQIRCMRIDTILCKNIKGDYQHLIQRLKEKAQISDFIETIATTFTTISPMLLYTMGGFLIINSNLELGALVSFITLSTYFTGPFQTLSLIIPQISVLRETMLRINELMNYSDEIQSGKQSIGRFESISLKNVTFKYLGSNEPDLKGINITIKRGEKIAIVGESGSGKTTISKLLLNALTKYEGEILLNGYNINSIKREAIDHIFTIVTQVPMAISGTIRDNIDISHDLSDDEIYSCLKTAELENDVNKFPMKLNTFVGENGQNISGGKKQRIAIARALALKPEVLILDEATSNLDPITERKICDNLKKLHITQIIITHRLSQVEDADMIYVLNHGEIMEKGSHEQLMKGKGLYSKLVRIA